MSSIVVISIPKEDGIAPKQRKKIQFSFLDTISSFRDKKCNNKDVRKVIHSVKVGIALVLVSFLYLLDPLFKQVGENAMWAIMTVVVVFEFFAGATLSKGLNRGIGTIVGGGLGCLVAILADEIDGIGNPIAVGSSVFIFAAAATYSRMIPSIKRRYDYGAMIFILTFNLVVVSGVRADKIMELARERLSTIGCLDEYFIVVDEKEKQAPANFSGCKSVLHSKSSDESLANFARWEPWHGKFGISYPWEKYLEIGEVLRELAATILSLKGCLNSSRQPSSTLRQSIKEPCEAIGSSLAWNLRELGESIMKMRRCRPKGSIAQKLESMKLELGLIKTPSKLGTEENGEGLAIASLVFLLMEIIEKVEILAEKVEELGELASFQTL